MSGAFRLGIDTLIVSILVFFDLDLPWCPVVYLTYCLITLWKWLIDKLKKLIDLLLNFICRCDVDSFVVVVVISYVKWAEGLSRGDTCANTNENRQLDSNSNTLVNLILVGSIRSGLFDSFGFYVSGYRNMHVSTSERNSNRLILGRKTSNYEMRLWES